MVNILIAEDDVAFREILTEILDKEKEFNILDFATTEDDVVELTLKYDPDIILLDIQLKNGLGINALKQINKDSYKEKDIKIIILSSFYNKEYVDIAIKYNISAYLLKENIKEKLAPTIKNVLLGVVAYDQKINNISKELYQKNNKEVRRKWGLLTEKEKEVVKLISMGYQNSEIAERLYLSVGRVKNIITSINRKIKTTNGKEIAVFGYMVDLD